MKRFIFTLIALYWIGLRVLAQGNLFTAYSASTTMNNIAPVYGVQGVAAAGNEPGNRQGAVTWTDNMGNLWLFGGSTTIYGPRSDLWKYNTTTNLWTWVKGPNTPFTTAVYGTMGVSAPSNNPGYRIRAGGWTDANGDLWLYGGLHMATTFDDLWKYTLSTNEWTWIKGSQAGNSSATFGIKGIPSINNTPGARSDFVTGTDLSGNFWLFGGNGIVNGSAGTVGDLWKYDVVTNNWTWINGPAAISTNGVYFQKGMASLFSYPGSRASAAGCSDKIGNLWVFGGNGHSQSNYGFLNDLWCYNFNSGLWTWAAGYNLSNDTGYYGNKKVPSQISNPPKRFFCTMQSDNLNNIWLFGGNDGTLISNTQIASHSGNYNDLWCFYPTTGVWAWMAGDSTWDQQGNFSAIGVANPHNKPGARNLHQMWRDNSGGLWFQGGGAGISNPAASGWYADLWRYSTCNAITSTLNPIPQISVVHDSVICAGEATTLTVTGAPTYTVFNIPGGTVTAGSGSFAVVSSSTVPNYQIVTMNNYGCTAHALVTMSVNACLGLTTNDQAGIRVFPNPFVQDLKIDLPGYIGRKIKVCDFSGQLVHTLFLEASEQKVNLSHLPSGIYFFYFETEHQFKPVKIIKE